MADPIATAADYADALITARRSQTAVFLLILLVLLVQLGFFLVGHFTDALGTHAPAMAVPATAPSLPGTPEAGLADLDRPFAASVAAYFVGLSAFVGVVLSIVLAMILLLIVKIMLVGRLIGVARLTSAYIWSLVLIVLLFPWQALLEPAQFKIPGVLYFWESLAADLRSFPEQFSEVMVLKWTRYVVAPLAAVIVLLAIRVKAQRGLRQALGETPPDVDEA